MKPHILYEDHDILVCLKPAGTPTQTHRPGLPDMVSILKNYLHQNSPSKKPPYLAVIHRLDQPVEGLLVFAKTPAAAKELNRQLQNSGFGKYYLAVLSGCPKTLDDTLEDFLVKDGRTNTSRVCSKETPGAKLARLTYHIEHTDGLLRRSIWIPGAITRSGYRWHISAVRLPEIENTVRQKQRFSNCSFLPAVCNFCIQKQKSTWSLPMRLI